MRLIRKYITFNLTLFQIECNRFQSKQFANLFETNSAAEWLLYISEWKSQATNTELSNVRVTTKVAVNALLGDTPNLQNYGSAIMHNLGTKEVPFSSFTPFEMTLILFRAGV